MEIKFDDGWVKIHQADCRDMSFIADKSVQCVVTSPPYWGLRKYSGEQELVWDGNGKCKHSGAWRGAYGLEPTPEMYVQHTIEILRGIRRVLRKDGVVFWNIADSYASGKGSCYNPGGGESSLGSSRKEAGVHPLHRGNVSTLKACNLKPKDLCLIPFRVAIAAQEDGWWVRSVIIWSKPNPMPESVKDRPTEAHEYILMLTKSARYYWDADAVREPQTQSTVERAKYPWFGKTDDGSGGARTGSTFRRMAATGELIATIPSDGSRNIRSVWEFPTEPFPPYKVNGKEIDHFAVFPPALPEKCILAATPPKCCAECGAPWKRITEVTGKQITKAMRVAGCDSTGRYQGEEQKDYEVSGAQLPSESKKRILESMSQIKETLGWRTTCKCEADTKPALILDPLAGAGTVGKVAKELGRKAILIDISEEYCQLAQKRIEQVTLPMELGI